MVFPQTKATTTRVRTMGQSYPLIRPGPGTNPTIYPPFLVPTRRCLPEGRIPKGHFFFFFLTRFCSLMIMVLRTSPTGDLIRLSFAPPPIHLFMAWRVNSLSVRYRRFSLSRWASRHSRSATSSGWFELMPSSSRSTHWECRSLCSLRWGGARCCPVSHPSEDRLQKPVPIV